MRPPEDARTRIVNEWRRKADADMAVADHLPSDEAVFLNAVTFHCQQAAEKYLKALLTCWGIEFPKTHVLARLIGLVETRDASLAATLLDAVVLTPYGVDLRYPGDRPDATPEEAREAIRLVRQVRDAVLPLLPEPPAQGR
ncbi:MAG TPA: HEPN domain-containing protein [Phycisphaerae bacterium]|nr:HEPN domain-containing protein [Phycisphaerae bacterium]